MNPAWVVGEGGLLGSAVAQALPERLPGYAPWSAGRLGWGEPGLEAQLTSAAAAYARASAEAGGRWAVLWCAGAGVVGTSSEAMARETRTLERFLEVLGAELGGRPGVLFLASSAGGVYGANPESPLTEASAPQPVNDYGRAKRRQEELLEPWAAAHPAASTVVGRIANLYGPGQNLAKPQGLISNLSRCLLHHVPAHVFAPLDTLRDYLYAPDAAAQVLACAARALALPEPVRVTKLIASGQVTSIGGLLAIFNRIAKRQPRIVCAATSLTAQQPSRLALRSAVWTDLPLPPPTPLAAGIQAVYASHLALLQAGRLPLPPQARR